MSSVEDWLRAEEIKTRRLALMPLRIEHADEMFRILDDPSLYTYTGGEPPRLEQLRARYARQVAGHSSDGARGWLNWIIRHRRNQSVVGTVQATLSHEEGRLSAEVAWIVAVAHQRRGYATEAASAVVGWLGQHGVEVFTAHIHPKHDASIAVARRLGLTKTNAVVDGEARWATSGESNG